MPPTSRSPRRSTSARDVRGASRSPSRLPFACRLLAPVPRTTRAAVQMAQREREAVGRVPGDAPRREMEKGGHHPRDLGLRRAARADHRLLDFARCVLVHGETGLARRRTRTPRVWLMTASVRTFFPRNAFSMTTSAGWKVSMTSVRPSNTDINRSARGPDAAWNRAAVHAFETVPGVSTTP